MTSHPRLHLDPRVHSPVRFSLLSLLRSVDETDFGTAREVLGVSDSTLSQAVAALEEAGFVRSVRRRGLGSARVWLAVTEDGERQLRRHMETLHQISGL
ncbi:transcriptional regulator [Microbacterium sp. WHRI 7836]|uniref:transcriptional regulator n=1 Tax=Microbacterium TaxID=33882 RepID=UPI0032ED98DC